jgi:processive 1,2-diacylglycerol beta-glucosyltransferase
VLIGEEVWGMRVLFLSVTAGHGHHQAAKAVMNYLEEQNVACTMLDTFEYINPILSESIARGYLISTQFTPAVYGRLYRLAEKKEKNNAKFSISKLTNSILSRKLITYIREYDPDVIVCTHIFAAQIITQLRGKNLRARTIGIITDFTIHPFWEDTDLDYYITASELLHRQAIKKGIPAEKIKATGIPIHMKFSKKISQSEARRILGLEDKTTIFVMSGSMGYGNVVKGIRQLDKLDMDFQIISVCGNNKRLKKKIDKLKTKKKIYSYGFVDNVDVIMDASSCIVTKPGGLTVSESLAKGLPMILINPIPGQEDRNVEFLLNNGLAMKTSPTFPVDEAVFQLMVNEWKQQNLREMIKYIGKPNASKDLGDFIIQMMHNEN